MIEQEDIGIVKSYENGIATIEVIPTGACDSCAINGICAGKDKKIEHKIPYDKPLKVNDRVEIEIKAADRVFSSFLVFLFPLIVMVIFYVLARYALGLAEKWGILISMLSLLLSGTILKIIDKNTKLKIKIKGKIA